MNNLVKRQLGRHIVVSGAGSGIGRAIALRLAQEGASVSLLARGESALLETAEAISEMGSKAEVIPCDIRDRSAVDRAFETANTALGPIHAVIANSGIGGPNGDGADDRFFDLVNTNLTGTYMCLRAAERHMAPSTAARHMVVVSSILARIGVAGYTGYCASKAGLLGLVRALSAELAPVNIQVNAVCPGWVDTQMAHDGLQGMADAMGISKEAAFDIAMQDVPRGRMGTPDEVAGMVAWLVSEDALGMTGQGLDLNGGAFMS